MKTNSAIIIKKLVDNWFKKRYCSEYHPLSDFGLFVFVQESEPSHPCERYRSQDQRPDSASLEHVLFRDSS